MKIKLATAVAFAILGLRSAAACSLATSGVFEPTLEDWERHPGPKQTDSKSSGEYWESAPAPIVQIKRLTRGTTNDGSSCGDAGLVVLEIALPKESTYSLSEFGIYFRVKSGKQYDQIFPNVPINILVHEGKGIVSLAWLDGHPKHQSPLDLEVEAFLISNDLNIGPSTFFKLSSKKGG